MCPRACEFESHLPHHIFTLLLNRLALSNVQYDLRTLRGDVLGGVTAAVVGLPVALAFGLAAGLGTVLVTDHGLLKGLDWEARAAQAGILPDHVVPEA